MSKSFIAVDLDSVWKELSVYGQLNEKTGQFEYKNGITPQAKAKVEFVWRVIGNYSLASKFSKNELVSLVSLRVHKDIKRFKKEVL